MKGAVHKGRQHFRGGGRDCLIEDMRGEGVQRIRTSPLPPPKKKRWNK